MANSVMKGPVDLRIGTARLNEVEGLFFAMQADGRCQMRFVNGDTWYVFTVAETFLSLTKSTDGGQTFAQMWVK